MDLFNKYQLGGNTNLYGWLYFDQVAQAELLADCEIEGNGFNTTSAQMTGAYGFAFGDLTAN